MNAHLLPVLFYGFLIGFCCGVILIATIATWTIRGLLARSQNAD